MRRTTTMQPCFKQVWLNRASNNAIFLPQKRHTYNENLLKPADYRANERVKTAIKYEQAKIVQEDPKITPLNPKNFKLDLEKTEQERESEWMELIQEQFKEEDAFQRLPLEQRISKEFAKLLQDLNLSLDKMHPVQVSFLRDCIYPGNYQTPIKKDFFFKNAPSQTQDSFNLFLLPALEYIRNCLYEEMLTKRPGFRMLIVTHVRERAVLLETHIKQFIQQFKALDSYRCKALLGNTDLNVEIDYIDQVEPEIIISTPTRLAMHLKNSDYLNNLKFLVLDDADTLLSQYKEQVQSVIDQSAKDRMTVLFSTHLAENQVPEGIFVQKERISMVSEDQEKAMVNTKHEQVACATVHDAIKTVFSIAKSNRDKKVAIVFPTEQYTHAEFCHRIFAQHELYTYLHHTRLPQTLRGATMREFNGVKNGILICTSPIVSSLRTNVDIVVTVGAVQPLEYELRVSRTAHGKSPLSLVVSQPNDTTNTGINASNASGKYQDHATELDMAVIEQKAKTDDILCHYNAILFGSTQLTKKEQAKQEANAKRAQAKKAAYEAKKASKEKKE